MAEDLTDNVVWRASGDALPPGPMPLPVSVPTADEESEACLFVQGMLGLGGTVNNHRSYRRFWLALLSDWNVPTRLLTGLLTAILAPRLIAAGVPLTPSQQAKPLDLIPALSAIKKLPPSALSVPPSSPSPTLIQVQQNSSTLSCSWMDGHVSEATILRTLYFIALNYPYNALDTTFKKVLDTWVELTQKTPNPEEEGFLQELNGLLLIGDSNSQIWNWVESCSRLEWCLEPVTRITSTNSNLVASLPLEYLRFSMTRKETFSKICNDIIALLTRFSLSGAQLLAAFHIIKTFLCLCPHIDKLTASSLTRALQPYYLSRYPYSTLVYQLLCSLEKEESSPGSTIRTFIEEETPDLYSQSTRSLHPGRKVDILVDVSSQEATTLRDLAMFWKPWCPSIFELQCSILANILSRVLQIDADLLGLGHISPELLPLYLKQAMLVMKHAATLPSHDARQFSIEKLTDVHKTIMQHLQAGCCFRSYNCQSLGPPPLQISFTDMPSDFKPPARGSALSPPLNIPVDGQAFNSALSLLVSKCTSEESVVKIGIVGKDTTAISVLLAYLHLKAQQTDMLKDKDILFYFFLYPDSMYTQLLCQIDPWHVLTKVSRYARFVCTLNKCALGLIPTVPAPTSRAKRGDSGHSECTTPRATPPPSAPETKHAMYNDELDLGQSSTFSGLRFTNPACMVRSSMEQYFREATWPIDITILLCECYSPQEPNEEAFFFTLPFLSTCVVTPSSSAAVSQITIVCLLLQPSVKSKDRNHPTLFIAKYAVVGMGGNCRPAISDVRRYLGLEVSQEWPSPSSGCMQLLLRADTEPKKSKRGSAIDVAWVEVTPDDPRKLFDVTLDGQLHGPFQKIRVSVSRYNVRTKLFIPPPTN